MNVVLLWAPVATLAVATVAYLINFIVSGREDDDSGTARWLGWIGTGATFLSLLLLTAAVIQFVTVYRRLPLATFVETALMMAWE